MIMSSLKRINNGKISKTQILHEVLPYSYISFDIFDTILKRNVQKPTDVFRLIEIELCSTYPEFKDKRVNAEKKARKLTTKEEITLCDIYRQYPGLTKIQIEDLMKAEMKHEAAVLTLNQDIFQVYQECLKMGKQVFLISDMYLSQEFILNILQSLGICNYKKIYISCEYGKTKKTGELFRLVLEEQGIRTNELIHIGDSIHSDYKTPKLLGIKAIHIPRFAERSSYRVQNPNNDIHINYLNAFLNNSVPTIQNEYYRFGYERFGMFLWGYVKWLYDSAIKTNIHKIYFLSRDGFIMKKAFDIINSNQNIQTYYLEVSRRSLRIPVLWMDPSFPTLLDMLTPSKIIPLLAIFDGVGLDINEYEDIIADYGFSKESVFDREEILENQKLLHLYSKILPDVIEVSKSEYEILKKYISQNHLYGRFALVDIGWSGGMQRYLEQVLNKLQIEHQILGYYVGIAPYYRRNIDKISTLDLNGYLFDFKHNSKDKDKRSCFVGLFETLFLEQGGSVKNYSESNEEKIIANRYPYEYIQDGKPTKEFLKIQEIQNGALDFIRRASQDEYLNKFTFTADELFTGIEKTGAKPDKLDLDLFADFCFFDEGGMTRLARPKSLFYYILRPKKLKNDFYMSRWKIGFMKKLFKLPFKYEYIYNFLKILNENEKGN